MAYALQKNHVGYIKYYPEVISMKFTDNSTLDKLIQKTQPPDIAFIFRIHLYYRCLLLLFFLQEIFFLYK